jgi:hypothetical protein
MVVAEALLTQSPVEAPHVDCGHDIQCQFADHSMLSEIGLQTIG